MCLDYSSFSLPFNYFPFVDLYCSLNGIKILGVRFGSVFFFFLPTKRVKQGCLTCKSASKVKRCSNSFLGSSLSVLPKDLLLGDWLAQVLWIVHIPFSASIGFSPHFLWGELASFL